jgi:hypothetical protein
MEAELYPNRYVSTRLTALALQDSSLHSDRYENLKSETDLVAWEIGTSVSGESAASMFIVNALHDCTA